MLLYPAAMSGPDRNPNFRTEPIGPPNRKRRAEGGSDTPPSLLRGEPQPAEYGINADLFPSRRRAVRLTNRRARATLAERGIIVQRKSDWSRRLRPARFSDARRSTNEAPRHYRLTELRATALAR